MNVLSNATTARTIGWRVAENEGEWCDFPAIRAIPGRTGKIPEASLGIVLSYTAG